MEVVTQVKSQLGKIIEELEKIEKKGEDVGRTLSDMGKKTGDAVDEATKKNKGFLNDLRSLSGRVADQLKRDFSSLASLNMLSGSMKLSEQFKGTISEAVSLSDTIRRLGTTFGITAQNFAGFQEKMVKGLGDIGLSSEAAANALKGLSTTPVRGEQQLIEYSKTSGMLAGMGGEKGNEGQIAQGITKVIQARGGDVNDVKQLRSVAEDLRKVFTQTGAKPTDTLKTMEQLFTGMSEDFRKTISTSGMAKIAAGAQVAGPNATGFIEEYLKKSKVERAGMEARGMGKVFTEQGINTEQVQKLYDQAKKLGGGDVRLGVKAATGIESNEQAEGFIRLAESLQKVKAAQEAMNKSTGTLEQQYRQSMGMGDAFRASINRLKATVSGPLASATQSGTNMLAHASESTGGAALVAGGGGLLAAMLAGGGLRGIGKGMGLAKGAAIEEASGGKVQAVYVTNASEIGGGLAQAASSSGLIGKASKAASVVGVGAAAYEIGTNVVNPMLDKLTQGTTKEGFSGNAVERLIFKLDKLFGGENARRIQQAQEVTVKMEDPRLKATKKSSRGASF